MHNGSDIQKEVMRRRKEEKEEEENKQEEERGEGKAEDMGIH